MNVKGFTLVEIVIAIAILAVVSVGIGSIVIGARNNSEKQMNEGELQQQLVEIQQSLRNDILATNAGVKYWVKESSGYTQNNGSDSADDKDKLLALYSVDYREKTVTKTYVKYDAGQAKLYKAIINEPATYSEDGKSIIINETSDNILAVPQKEWKVYAQEVDKFSMDLSKYDTNKVVNYDVKVANDGAKYNSDNTIKIRNDISVNSLIELDDVSSKTIDKPSLGKTIFEYSGSEKSPLDKESNFDSRYMERTADSVTAAINVGIYHITYHLKSPTSTWADGTTDDFTVEWKIIQKPVTVNWGQLTWVYNGSNETHSTTVSLTGIVPGDIVNPLLNNNPDLSQVTVGPGVSTKDVELTVDNNNYCVKAEDKDRTLAIVRASAKMQLPTAKDLVYNGSAQELLNPGTTNDGTIVYSLSKNGPFSTSIPTGIDSNNESPYVVYCYVQGDANHEDSDVVNIEVIIKKAKPEITAPKPIQPLFYNKQPQTLITEGSSTAGEGTMRYNVDEGDFSPALPQGVVSKIYKVEYKSIETSNYYESDVGSINVEIGKSQPGFKRPTGVEGLVYNGKQQILVNPGTADDGQWEYRLDGTDWSTDLPTGINAKDSYDVYYRLPATEDFDEVPEDVLHVKIAKADPVFTPPVPIPNLVYDETVQTLITEGKTNDGTFMYGFTNDKNAMSQALPTGVESKTYPIYYYVKGDSNHNDSAVGQVDGYIGKQKATVALPPQGVSVVYTGNPQELLSFGGQPEGNNGTIVYSLTPNDNSSWSDKFPQETNVNKYNIYYKVLGNANYEDSDVGGPVVSEITKARNIIQPPTPKSNLSFTGAAQVLAMPGTAKFGTMEYSLDNTTWQTSVPSGIEAGQYIVYYRVVETNNYDGTQGSINCQISKIKADITPPVGKTLTYNGTAQELIDLGSCNPGKLLYRLLNGLWQETSPTGTNVGNYVIEYKADAGSSYDDSVSRVVSQIVPAKNTITPPVAQTLIYSGSAQELVQAGTSKFGTMEYSLDNSTWSTSIPTGTNVDTYIVYWRVQATENYSGDSGEVIVKIEKRPIGTPSIIDKVMDYNETTRTPRLTYDDTYVTVGGETSGKEVRTYTISFTLKDIANTKWEDGTTDATRYDTWEIKKCKAYVTEAPTGVTVVFNEKPQSMVNFGRTNSGQIFYRIQGDSTWSLNAPERTTVGTYIVEYYIKGDANHFDSDIATVQSQITKATMNVSTPLLEFTYDGYQHPSGSILTINFPTNKTQTVVKYGNGDGNTNYVLDNYPTWSLVKWNNNVVDTYKIKVKITDPNFNDWTGTIEVKINPQTMIEDIKPIKNAEVTYLNAPYTGSAQNLITKTSDISSVGYYEYSTDNGNSWTKTIPQRTDAGEYPVLVRVMGDSNHKLIFNGVEQPLRMFSGNTENQGKAIIQKVAPSFTPPYDAKKTYNTAYQNVMVKGTTSHGTFEYAVAETHDYSARPVDQVGNNPREFITGKNAGEYRLLYRVVGDKNHTTTDYMPFTCKMAKANPIVTAPKARSLVYSPTSAQTLITAGSTTGGTLKYKLGSSGTYSTTLPTAQNAGKYTVYYKVFGDSNYNDSNEASISVTIQKAPAITKVTGKSNLIYSGSAQNLLASHTTSENGTFHFKVNNGSWGTGEPKGTNAGTYTVYYYVDATANYKANGSSGNPLSVTVNIGKADPKSTQLPTISGDRWTYNETSHSVSATPNGWTIQYQYSTNSGATWSNRSTTKPTRTNAGITDVNWFATHTNYKDQSGTVQLICYKANAYWTTKPTGTNAVGGTNTVLCTAGTAVGGTRYYATTGSWSTSRPSASSPGTYTVYFYIAGDENHNSTSQESCTAVLNQPAPSIYISQHVSGTNYVVTEGSAFSCTEAWIAPNYTLGWGYSRTTYSIGAGHKFKVQNTFHNHSANSGWQGGYTNDDYKKETSCEHCKWAALQISPRTSTAYCYTHGSYSCHSGSYVSGAPGYGHPSN